MSELSVKQQEIFDFILSEIEINGYPPTVREIGGKVGLSSSSSVHFNLERLEKFGFIKRDPTKPRAIKIIRSLS